MTPEISGLLIAVVLLAITFATSKWAEYRHLRRLECREKELSYIAVSDLKTLPPNWEASEPQLVSGEVVMANDYFRSFIAGWINIFGGRIRVYENLLERARREATVRMLEKAQAIGANCVWNVRCETSTLAGRKKEAGPVELFVYGTAMKVRGKQQE